MNVVLIGCGGIGRIHAQAICRTPGLELMSLVGGRGDSALRLSEEVYRQTQHRPAIFLNLEEALSAQPIDLVVIATPTGSHIPLAKRAIRAGKHVVIEKPLSVDLSAALELGRIAHDARKSGLVVSVISQRRFDPASVVVNTAIQRGDFGRLTSGVASVAWWRSSAYFASAPWRGTWSADGGGALMNQGIHTVDLLLWFMGRPVEVYGRATTLFHKDIEVEDTVAGVVQFESGAIASVHATTAAYPGISARVEIYGTRGSGIIEQDRLKYFHTAKPHDDVGDMGLDGQGDQSANFDDGRDADHRHLDPTLSPDGHVKQYLDIVQAIAEDREPLVTVSDAVRSVALIRAIYEASETGSPINFQDMVDRASKENSQR